MCYQIIQINCLWNVYLKIDTLNTFEMALVYSDLFMYTIPNFEQIHASIHSISLQHSQSIHSNSIVLGDNSKSKLHIQGSHVTTMSPHIKHHHSPERALYIYSTTLSCCMIITFQSDKLAQENLYWQCPTVHWKNNTFLAVQLSVPFKCCTYAL